MIIISKDFSYGTIRNKIIKGHSRFSIFMSIFIVSATILSLIMFAYATINGLLTLALFYDLVGEINSQTITYFLVSLLFELLVLIFVAALISFLATFMKNAGLAIVIYVALLLGLMVVNGILQIGYAFIENELLVDVLHALSYLNVLSTPSVIGMGTSYQPLDAFMITSACLLETFGLVSLGVVGFNKKDLK